MRYGDLIKAIPGTVCDMFAEGRIGKVVEVKNRGDVYSNNLVIWEGDTIVMGFHLEQVTKVES